MNAPAVTDELLREVPIFADLSEPERRSLADIVALAHFEAGEVVLRQGKISQNLWIVLEGECEVYRELPSGEEVTLAQLTPLSSFGEMSFFHEAPHSASVRAVKRLRLMRIRREDYNHLLKVGSWGAYKLAYNAVGTLAERLRRMDDRVAELLQRETENHGNQPECEWKRFQKKLFRDWNTL